MFKALPLLLLFTWQAEAAEYNLAQVPIGVTEAVEPNVMLLLDTSGSMGRAPVSGGASKMEQAKSAAETVIQSGQGMRIGLARLNGNDGGQIDQACGASQTDLLTTLNGYSAGGNTPVAEAHYEVSRYFRGMRGHFSHTGSNYRSPITHQCQKNFTIVLSDGQPTQDGNFSSLNDVDAGSNLPDWDRSDDDNYSYVFRGNTYSYARYFLDDLARFTWETDLSSQEGVQNMHTYTIGFDIDFPMLKEAAVKGHGEYFLAGNETELLTSLNRIFADISRKSFTETRLSANSGYVSAGLNLYQASYNTSDWTGELSAYRAMFDASTGHLGFNQMPSWQASLSIPEPSARRMYTNRGGVGIPFRVDKLNASDKRLLGVSSADELIRYTRGESVVGLRGRNTLLGDIVHSNPIYIGASRGFNSSASYRAFKAATKTREPMIYVGANDGMLHGFRASDGKELLAYIPSVLLPKLKYLAAEEYQHRYYVDGSPMVNDAFIDGDWRTMLAGGLNGGGQGVYVLDITDPDDFTEARADQLFAWEFTDSDDADMGYSYSQPIIVKLKDGHWYAVFGNGYNSTEPDGRTSNTGDAVIYLIDLATGLQMMKLSTDTGIDEAPAGLNRPNGMATLSPVSDDGETVDVIYGGDLYGNVWKFDLSSADSAQWGLAYKLFQACRYSTGSQFCSASDIQAITAGIAVSEDKKGRNMLFFGTGKDFESSDKTDRGLQTLYGVIDKGRIITGGRSALLEQRIYQQGTFDIGGVNRELRLTTNNLLQESQAGWFMDLQNPDASGNGVTLGERVLVEPQLTGLKVTFATKRYTADPCRAGGESSELSLDKFSGSRLSYVTADNNRDGRFDDQDKVTDSNGGKVVASGETLGNGAGSTVIVGDDYNFRIGADDQSDPKKALPDGIQRDPDSSGRTSWRYLERD
ncbi:type IV pilus assembly protein PilY1 [Amphritea japonica ATCC BAA-1530]|uniref:Type IV pilus assembly protein PilY1 n=2 Tax=Amphritea TaxID=515417 RepID=A0A7R6PGB3_9GAMM|nr:type IV pilus assembly protein PilY1 [Amphritea japonica ATCC BAA-1530]